MSPVIAQTFIKISVIFNVKKNKKIREVYIQQIFPSIDITKFSVGGEGFEPPKASANGFTVRPGSPTPASALKLKKEQ